MHWLSWLASFYFLDFCRRYICLDAGGPSMYRVRWSNEAATVHADITADHRDVPAIFSVMGRGSTQEPPSRFSFSKTLQTKTKSFSFMSAPVRFSQSDWVASEQVNSSSQDVERIPSHSFSLLIIQPFLSGLLRCFCTCDAFHINNSISYFWASVCACVTVGVYMSQNNNF